MKIRIREAVAEGGNVLLMTVIITSIIAGTLAAYLTLVHTAHRLTQSSQTWNSLIPTVEAGLEEAMAHLNNLGAATNRAVDGWSKTNVAGTSYVYRERNLGDQSFKVLITEERAPTIRSFAFGSSTLITNEVDRQVKVDTFRLAGLWNGMVAKGLISLGPGSIMDSYNSGDPRYNTNGRYDPTKAKDNSFVGSVNADVVSTGSGGDIHGVVGTGPSGSVTGVDVGTSAYLNGGGKGIQPGAYYNDLSASFPDVSAPFASAAAATPGTYTNITYTYGSGTVSNATTFPSPAPTNGVTTNYTTVNTVTLPSPLPALITTNFINYTITNWPGATNAPITTNTTAVTGATSPPASGTYVPPVNVVINVVKYRGKWTTNQTYSYNSIVDYTYKQSTYSYTNETYTYATTTTTTNISTTYYDYLLGDGNYMNNLVSLSGSRQIYVAGNATWYITGNFKLGGSSSLIIAPGASLNLYVGGSADFRGNGVVNPNDSSLSFQLWGMPTCTSVTLAGNGQLTGTMYAPSATLYGRGGGSDVLDHSGAAVMNAVNFNGHYNFHYDELLGDQDDEVKYYLGSWEEMMTPFAWSSN